MTQISNYASRLIEAVLNISRPVPQKKNLPLGPIPASRPRVTRWGTYYTKTYAAWKIQAEALAKELPGTKADGPIALILEHVCKKPKTTKREWPVGDIDNFSKASMDAITKAQRIYTDDDQVIALIAVKRFAESGEEPHCNIWAHKIGE